MISGSTSAIDKKNVDIWNDILFNSCIAGIIGLAIFFRSQGYFDGNISFWWDEAHWADWLIEKPLKDVSRIRPVGYMFLTKQLIKISTDETVFRLVSYLSSILALPLVFLIARRIWRAKIAVLLMVFFVAFNPILISFAKEFKPYASDFFIHACLIYITLEYIHLKKDSLLYAILAFAVASILFCYNIVFIFPAIFLILLFDAYSRKNHKNLAIITAAILLLFVLLFLLNYFFFSNHHVAEQESYWGNKYDVFYLGSNLIERLKWIVIKYVGLVKSSGRAEIFWNTTNLFAPVIDILLLILHFVGIIGFIIERNFRYLLLFFLTIATVILLNSFGIWPFGPFRVNVFLVIYFLVLTVNGFNFLINRKSNLLRYSVLCIVIAFLFMLRLPINFQYYNIKPSNTWTQQSNVRQALDTIIQYETKRLADVTKDARKVSVIIENHALFPTLFYYDHHPDSAGYVNSIEKLNLKYYLRRRGSRTIDDKGITTGPNDKTIIGMMLNLSQNPIINQEDIWLVLGRPSSIKIIEPIIDNMPERIVLKRKFSYGSLVVLLKKGG